MMQEALEAEPRWTAYLAAFVIPLLQIALPAPLRPKFAWLLPVVAILLMIGTGITHRRKLARFNEILGFSLETALTFSTVVSLFNLVRALVYGTKGEVSGPDLLGSAALLWVANVLIFALWFWRLDAGGPNQRDARGHHRRGAFLFPQMQMSEEELGGVWRPGFVDYLFLAFNTSTAFSPTDAAPLDQGAKVAMMVQALISLTIIALVAARGVNIL
ncbi:DUF1345 domain-containing protein [bacterium]|nr:MAG: DUF1345 domain-containing protein [bacterium]